MGDEEAQRTKFFLGVGTKKRTTKQGRLRIDSIFSLFRGDETFFVTPKMDREDVKDNTNTALDSFLRNRLNGGNNRFFENSMNNVNNVNNDNNDKDSTEETLADLIESSDWVRVRQRCRDNPSEIEEIIDPNKRRTILHLMCTKPPAPEDIFRTVVETYPKATKIAEGSYKALPLHIMCWSSQRSVRKVQILLDNMNPEDVMAKNRWGGTALHSACGSNASMQVIKLIIKKNPAILTEQTYDYRHTAFTALWQSHLQTIQGHMQIARILEGDVVNEGHFERFWEKAELLARESFKLSPACPKDIDPESNDYIVHGLLTLRAPLNAMKVALRRTPEWAAHPDADGNYPLHHIVMSRPFRAKDIEVIKELVRAYPQAASKPNNNGDTPLFIAIRNRMDWDEGLGQIVQADAEALSQTDPSTGLFPFLLAASVDGRVAVNSTYQLLCARPFLVKDATSL